MTSQLAVQNWQFAQQFEAQLKALLKRDPPPTYDETEHAISQLRIASEAVLFADFQFATSVKAEGRLWDAHTLINGRYRRLMEKVKKQQKNHVERRSLAKHYADFIKTSQFFYKGYIQRLASHFDGLDGLRRIANSLSLSTLTVDRRQPVSPDAKRLIERSCHSTLMRLGDLSRYRNTFRIKDRSWAPALGYYTLANDFYPENGYAHQQMAVIALAEENHLDALYHLYRALSTKEPHQLAAGNLEHEFKKIIIAFDKKLPQPMNDKVSTLCGWFVVLHAKFSEGVDFSGKQKELEREILSRLALLLKEQAFGETLEKLVIVNIAAQYIAGNKTKNDSSEKNLTSYKFYLGFNIRMMFLLLEALVPELENDSEGEEIPKGTSDTADRPEPAKEIITAVARRILPALRQYSTWLATSASFIMAISTPQSSDITTATRILELWQLYATVLTKLNVLFPVGDLPFVDYLLEEDESTVGFEPLLDADLPPGCNLFKSVNGQTKPRITDQGRAREHPNIEMQSRIRDILIVGLALAMDDNFPVNIERSGSGLAFTFRQPGSHYSSPLQYASSSAFPTPANTTSNTFSPREVRPSTYEVDRNKVQGAMDAQQSMESDMSRMVDDLVEPSSNGQSNETSYGMHSRTANEVFAPISSNGYDSQYRSTPKMLPSLPGLYNSAFTPQPHELKPTSPIRPGTGGQLSPLSLNSEEQRRDAAIALDNMTGFPTASAPWGRQASRGSSSSHKSLAKQLDEGVDDPEFLPPKNSSWGRQSSRPVSGSLPRPVNQILHKSLAQQFMQSSNFSDSSSLYANSTPMPDKNGPASSWHGAFGAVNDNSTVYAGASDFDRDTMLQSSIWNGSQAFGPYVGTPPGGQGG